MTTRLLSRRAVLRGMGTVVALPLLESLLPRGMGAEKAAKAPRRLAFIYSPERGGHAPLDAEEGRGRLRVADLPGGRWPTTARTCSCSAG